MLTSAEIRQRFIEFFEQRGHTVVASSSLVPGNDPTLLFTNAGMVQFKDIYTGLETRSYTRAVTAQRCMRVSGKHNDLDEVGPSPRHHTLFEMLGNFSFGDYFKPEAITWGWEFLTKEMGIDRERLYVTVYQDDDEAIELWRQIADIPLERIYRLGKKDNFWEMGDTGPCGPCSEIIYDRGPEACTCGDPNCNLDSDCDRWLELWNLVFTQFEQSADGTLTPLPKPNIDTGLGLERITSVLQGVGNNYDTDLFQPIMRKAAELLGKTEEEMRADIVPYRVIADHSRAVAFLISDGVQPGNVGRGYVVRMVLRRAARFGRRLGFDGPFMAETAQVVIDLMGEQYPGLREQADFIKQVITREEERFLRTLSTGLARFDELAERVKAAGETVIPGDEAFDLYSTFGFPLELTQDAAAELSLTVDVDGYQTARLKHSGDSSDGEAFDVGDDAQLYRGLALPKTEFLGYDALEADAKILSLVVAGSSVDTADEGDEVQVVLDRTPFYGEAGGQVGDTGTLEADGALLTVEQTSRPIPDTFVHQARVTRGTVRVGDAVRASVDTERRLDIARNHTGTHLLHRALRDTLGEHATQSGSMVAPDRMRFDFAHLTAMTPDEIAQVERQVNAAIRANHPVSVRESSYDEAVHDGATALFGEKYGDRVRVVTVEGYSIELCGGTHLQATGQIGGFHILSESSIGSGLRRIEAVTGRGYEEYMRQRLAMLESVGAALSARPGDELTRLEALQEENRSLRHSVQQMERSLAASRVDSLLDEATEIAGIKVLAAQVEAADVDTLRDMADRFRDKLGTCLVALGAVIEDKPLLVVALTGDAQARGLHAGKIAGAAAKKMGGGGGGRPNIAQAGGRDAAALADALEAVIELATAALS